MKLHETERMRTAVDDAMDIHGGKAVTDGPHNYLGHLHRAVPGGIPRGGALKRKEMLSARFGDILSELYLLSAVLKRWQDEGRQKEDFAALEWCMATGFRTIENRLAAILANLPNRFVAGFLKLVVQPFGARVLGPSDRVVHQCASLVLEPTIVRERLTPDLA